jgi:hypothetical protein
MWKSITILVLAIVLGGCASLNQLSNDVSTYSLWPADRKPATYSFERLPSQQTNPQQTQVMEDAAARALLLAGFAPASDPNTADVTVTLGARITGYYDDPWWHGGPWVYGYYGRPYYWHNYGYRYGYPWGSPWGPGWGYPWGPYWSSPVYEREVAILIRDRKSGQVLYETRVSNSGYTSSMATLLPAMFEAGLKDFPQGGVSTRRVVTQISAS